MNEKKAILFCILFKMIWSGCFDAVDDDALINREISYTQHSLCWITTLDFEVCFNSSHFTHFVRLNIKEKFQFWPKQQFDIDAK